MTNISHAAVETDFKKALAAYQEKHKHNAEILKIINDMAEFEFGAFLLQHRGINGFWTQYLCTYPDRKPILVNDLEEWMMTKAPVFLATQQRFKIFRQELQAQVRDGVSMASLPCGLMDDLLELDWNGIQDFSLTGIDIDPMSLALAKENAATYNLSAHCQFVPADAWKLSFENKFDVLTSNGLNIYEPDDEQVTALYAQFHKALKAGGTLVTSFVTPPPAMDPQSPWKLDQINVADLAKQKLIFSEILAVNWQAFRTQEKTREQLTKAGFKEINFFDDPNCLFPTVVATR